MNAELSPISQHEPPVSITTPSQSATELVFERLLSDIVSGTYTAGARLPAERELAKILGASRPTLREALSRLAEWNLVRARRGSGIAVRPQSEWMIDVMPSFLRFADPTSEVASRRQMVHDLLQLRRKLIIEILGMVTDRVPLSSLPIAREVVEKAWAERADGKRFAEADIDVLRYIVQAADFLPALWMLNRMSGIYSDLADSLGPALAPPEGYLEAWLGVLASYERRNSSEAISAMNDYLAACDERLMALLVFMG